MLESELFGYDSGAFTGALKKGKPGVFEMADGGTLFLDEIAELPLSAQATLLHVLDGEPFRRVGGTVNIRSDVRIDVYKRQDESSPVSESLFRQAARLARGMLTPVRTMITARSMHTRAPAPHTSAISRDGTSIPAISRAMASPTMAK